MFTAWLMVVAAGVDKLLLAIGGLPDPTQFLQGLAGQYVGGWLGQAMNILFVSSLFAGVLAFHNGMSRYMYVAGREKLLPAVLGATHGTHQSPHVGSMVQTVIAVLVIVLFAITGQDPVLALFTWLTQVGTLGIVALVALTSISVIAFFRANPGKEGNVMKSLLLPAIAAVALIYVVYQSVAFFGTLTGASGFLGVFLPGLVVIAALVGVISASLLKSRSPADHAKLGSQQF